MMPKRLTREQIKACDSYFVFDEVQNKYLCLIENCGTSFIAATTTGNRVRHFRNMHTEMAKQMGIVGEDYVPSYAKKRKRNLSTEEAEVTFDETM